MCDQTTLTDAEKVFAKRMMPYLAQGMGFEDAARAVIQRDREIYNAVMSDKRVYNAVADSMAEEIYNELCK